MMMRLMRTLSFSAAVILLLSRYGVADDYLELVKPVLKARCYACHGALKQEADLRLDTAVAIREREDGTVVDLKQPELSELLVRVSSKDDDIRMPPEGEPLKLAEIAAIRKWHGLPDLARAPSRDRGDSQVDRNRRSCSPARRSRQ